MTTALCVALWLAFTPAPTQTALPPDPSLIRVRVTTDDAGVAEELAARRNSVTHLAAALGANKKSGLTIVTRPDDPADIVVDVQDRGVTVPKVVIGIGRGMGSPTGRAPLDPQPVKAAQLRVTVTIANDKEPVEIKNTNRASDTESGWKSAAEDIAKQIDKWIAAHRAAILAARRGH